MLKNSPLYLYRNFCARQRQSHPPHGLPVELTYNEWYSWWSETGKYHLRGPRPNDYCMARIDKNKGWNLDNIHCIQNKHNKIFNMSRADLQLEITRLTTEMSEWRSLALDFLYKDIENKKLDVNVLLSNALDALARERGNVAAAKSTKSP